VAIAIYGTPTGRALSIAAGGRRAGQAPIKAAVTALARFYRLE
jgi:hypothetical protein